MNPAWTRRAHGKASLTLARILFPQCPAIWRDKSWHFSGTKSVKTAKWRTFCAMLRHVAPSVTHKLWTVHEMSDTRCHACVLHSVVATSRDTLENCFEHFTIFATTWHALLHQTRIPTHPSASPRTLSQVIISLARQIACHGVNPLSCQCGDCLTSTTAAARNAGQASRHTLRKWRSTDWKMYIPKQMTIIQGSTRQYKLQQYTI